MVNGIISTHHTGAILVVCHTPVLEEALLQIYQRRGLRKVARTLSQAGISKTLECIEEAESRLVGPPAGVTARQADALSVGIKCLHRRKTLRSHCNMFPIVNSHILFSETLFKDRIGRNAVKQ